jgi:hypothetical protein
VVSGRAAVVCGASVGAPSGARGASLVSGVVRTGGGMRPATGSARATVVACGYLARGRRVGLVKIALVEELAAVARDEVVEVVRSGEQLGATVSRRTFGDWPGQSGTLASRFHRELSMGA